MANQGRCQEADARSKSLQPGGRTAHSDVPAGPDGEDGRPRAASSLLVPGEQEDGPGPHPRLGPTASMCPDSNGRGLWSPGLDTSHLAAGQGPHPYPISVLPACCSQVEDELQSSGVQSPAPPGRGDHVLTGNVLCPQETARPQLLAGRAPAAPHLTPQGRPPPRTQGARTNEGEAFPPAHLCLQRPDVCRTRRPCRGGSGRGSQGSARHWTQGGLGSRGDRLHSAPGGSLPTRSRCLVPTPHPAWLLHPLLSCGAAVRPRTPPGGLGSYGGQARLCISPHCPDHEGATDTAPSGVQGGAAAGDLRPAHARRCPAAPSPDARGACRAAGPPGGPGSSGSSRWRL